MNSNKTLVEFEYRDLGSMATIGKHKAVVGLPFLSLRDISLGLFGCSFT